MALLWNTGNYIQHPVINHNGKEYKKEYVYIQRIESLLCIRNILQFKKKEERSEFPNYMKNTHQALLRASWGLREGSKRR